MFSAQEIHTYFRQSVQPLFSDLIAKVIANRPEDIRDFAIRYFEHHNRPSNADDSDQEPDRFVEVSQSEFNKERERKWGGFRGKWTRRLGMYPQAPQRKAINMKSNGTKDETTQIKLRFLFSSSFLFQDFTQNDFRSLIDSMAMRKTKPDEIIIRQHELLGDCMYFVDSGLYQSLVPDKNNKDSSVVLKCYQEGDVFGELCLLHDSRSQTMIVSKTDGVLYSLDRDAYKHFKKMSIVKRRTVYLENLKKVKILASLSKEDLEKLCDLLQETSYESNEVVIHEGDLGSKFFIVIEGLLVAKRAQDDTLYQCYKEGDYFGQLALIKNKPRQISVVAVTKCKLVSLSSSVFLNVINLARANIEISQKYKNGRPITNARKKKPNTFDYPDT